MDNDDDVHYISSLCGQLEERVQWTVMRFTTHRNRRFIFSLAPFAKCYHDSSLITERLIDLISQKYLRARAHNSS